MDCHCSPDVAVDTLAAVALVDLVADYTDLVALGGLVADCTGRVASEGHQAVDCTDLVALKTALEDQTVDCTDLVGVEDPAVDNCCTVPYFVEVAVAVEFVASN